MRDGAASDQGEVVRVKSSERSRAGRSMINEGARMCGMSQEVGVKSKRAEIGQCLERHLRGTTGGVVPDEQAGRVVWCRRV